MIINVHQSVEPQAPPPQYESNWHYTSQQQPQAPPSYNFQNTRAADNIKRY